MSWRPTAPLANLKARAAILEAVRAFFKSRDVLEVDTPILGQAPVTDPHLMAMTTKGKAFPNKTFYLQTSPEYYLKRLLVEYGISCYQLGKCFRDDEYGHIHSPEFLMLEWYHISFNDFEMMQEVENLLSALSEKEIHITRLSYQEAFQQYLAINPHKASLMELQNLVKPIYPGEVDRDLALQLLMSEVVERGLAKRDVPVFIYDFPALQAALAKIKILEDGTKVGARFELYWRGVELGNGYHELTNATEQNKRFETDLAKRKKLGIEDVPVDKKLLSALERGLPECAGIAIGMDRLIMVLLQEKKLSQVQSFFEF